VLLLPGSGPLDRNSDHKRMPLGITGQLATALDTARLATFRYDKRGVGESTGRWHTTGFYDNRDDAAAALEFLAARPDIDPARIVVLGHSEGALHAANLAAAGARTAGLVLLSCSATPGEALLRWQSAQIGPTLPRAIRALLRLLRTDLETRTAKTHAKIKATTTDQARIEGAKINTRWHREFMAHDPRTDLARVTVPVIALTGGKDLQVPAADLATIRDLVQADVETHELGDLSHILRAQPGPASLFGYKREMRHPLDAELVGLVVAWVQTHVGGTR
jgi:pimeloyl-ACP methyl ester carboxylesterase